MSDIFISYARDDTDRAEALATLLRDQGWTVWWDRRIKPGLAFDETIDSSLQKSRCVLVLWSAASVASRWVFAEAEDGASRGILVPARIEPVRLPLPFRRIQTVDLTDWDGTPGDVTSGLHKLFQTITEVVNGPAVKGSRGSSDAARLELNDETQERLSMLFSASSILLLADRFSDGSWARTLWRVGGKDFTQDVGNEAAIAASRVKKAIGVSAWAANSLLVVFGDSVRPILDPTSQYIRQFYDQRTGGFGFVYQRISGTPLIASYTHAIPNPRHTATAIKFLHQLDGFDRVVGRSLHFLVAAQDSNGSWGEDPAQPGNTLSTTYVLDTLLKLRPSIGTIRTVLDTDETQYVLSQYDVAIERGMSWLLQQQEKDGSWGYRAGDEKSPLRPYYTVHVFGLLPQLLQRFPQATMRLTDYLQRQVVGGGYPARTGGPPEIAPTAMMLLGLWRADPNAFADVISAATHFLASKVGRNSQKLEPMHIFDSIFSLWLGQYPEFCSVHWRQDTLRILRQEVTMLEPRYDSPTDEAALRPLHRRILNLLDPAMRTFIRQPLWGILTGGLG